MLSINSFIFLPTVVFATSFFVASVYSVKRIGDVCDPTKKAECGLHAVCNVPNMCSRGRCKCESSDYREEPTVDSPHPENCVRLLAIGDTCTADDQALINLEAGHVCFNGSVTCTPNFEPLLRNGKTTCQPKANVRSYSEQCNETIVCNQFIGLTCSFSAQNPSVKTCQCRTGLRIAVNANKYAFGVKCTFPEYHESCDDTAQCLGQYNNLQNKAFCNKVTGFCDCSPGYEASPYVANYLMDTYSKSGVAIKQYCVSAAPQRAKLDEKCTVLGPMVSTKVDPTVCEQNLVCYNCPEFDAGDEGIDNARPGKCFAISALQQRSLSQRNSGQPGIIMALISSIVLLIVAFF